MQNRFDELTRILAGSVPRREALKRLGGLVAGAFLGLFGLGGKAQGQGPTGAQLVVYCTNLCNLPCPYLTLRRFCYNPCIANGGVGMICAACTFCACAGVGQPCSQAVPCCPGLFCDGFCFAP